MNANKDEALTCLKIGKDALRLNDRIRALKFISKAKRLDPSLQIEDLLSDLKDNPANKSSKSPESDNSGVRRRVPATGSTSESGSETYTEEQISIVTQIQRKNDFYEILDLEKSCTVEDIRKAYRKLSLKVHPDKNNAPGSDEAFKKVSMAFKCLSVDDDRKRYDSIGSSSRSRPRPRSRSDESVNGKDRNERNDNGDREFGNNGGYYDGYDGDFDPEMIFRNFFFGETDQRAAPSAARCTGNCRGRRRAGNGVGGLDPNDLVMFLVVVLVAIVCFLVYEALFKRVSEWDDVWDF